jgi:hypothetical protein
MWWSKVLSGVPRRESEWTGGGAMCALECDDDHVFVSTWMTVRTIGGVGILRRTMLEAVWQMHETRTMGFHSVISGVSMESIA